MEKTVELLEDSIRGIKTGTIGSGLVDTIRVVYHGQNTPIKHIAFTSVENGLVIIKPYDQTMVGTIQKVLKSYGLNAYLHAKSIIAVSIPKISGEERERIKAHVRKLGEESKISIRNIRRLARQAGLDDDIQKTTDKYIGEIDKIISKKLENLSK